jgi:hypothetical protein
MFSAANTSNTSNNNISSGTFQLLNVPTKLNNVDYLIRASHQNKPETPMADGYVPSDSDVCCGRGKQHWNATGNVNFRKVIRASVARYMQGPLKTDKTAVVVSVVDEIRRQGGRFLKQQQKDGSNGCWYDIGDAAARDKVGHSLRDKSTTSAKSPLQQAKEQTRQAADAASRDSDSVDSAAAILTETSSLSSLSPSPSFSCVEEMIVDFGPITILSRGPSLLPTDLLPTTNSSQLLVLSDFLIGCFDF